MDINTWGFIVGVLGLIATVFSLGYAFYATRQFSKGIRIGSLRQIRIIINRLNEDKGKIERDTLPWLTMDHSQQELEGLSKNLQEIFNISDKDADKYNLR